MRFTCKPAEISFLEEAPVKLSYSEIIEANPEQTYAALMNPQTWPKWFPGMTSASAMESGERGLFRIVTLDHLIRFKEEFIVHENPHCVAYRVAAVSIPYADELVEEFRLSPRGQVTEITYRIGLRVHPWLKLLNGVVRKVGERSYVKALPRLKAYLEQ